MIYPKFHDISCFFSLWSSRLLFFFDEGKGFRKEYLRYRLQLV